jgi:lipid-A-disaccharide synthase-like uncharacterized protein
VKDKIAGCILFVVYFFILFISLLGTIHGVIDKAYWTFFLLMGSLMLSAVINMINAYRQVMEED